LEIHLWMSKKSLPTTSPKRFEVEKLKARYTSANVRVEYIKESGIFMSL